MLCSYVNCIDICSAVTWIVLIYVVQLRELYRYMFCSYMNCIDICCAVTWIVSIYHIYKETINVKELKDRHSVTPNGVSEDIKKTERHNTELWIHHPLSPILCYTSAVSTVTWTTADMFNIEIRHITNSIIWLLKPLCFAEIKCMFMWYVTSYFDST